MRKVTCPSPSAVLLEEFLQPMGITQHRLAREIGVPLRHIGEIVAGKRVIDADTGLRLSRFFGMSEGFWIVLQAAYDRERAKDALARTLAKIKPWCKADSPSKARSRGATASALPSQRVECSTGR